jgi:hypothetical protein
VIPLLLLLRRLVLGKRHAELHVPSRHAYDHLYSARVPRDKILERSSWEFLSGDAAAPAWSKAESAARPIFRDPRHVGHSDMTYNPGLKRYLLSVFSDTVPHVETATVTK